MGKKSVTLSLDEALWQKLESIAAEERRSLSSMVEIALEDWLKMREELHPQFIADIKEALTGVNRGEIEDYEI
ncbi:MAG: ribbon-helix-helix protein, CopG family [Candidatus Bipolaricaulia bacterium]